MENIGVIIPYIKARGDFLKSFFVKKVVVEEYALNFIIVNDRQNFRKIFKRKNIKYIVVLTECNIQAHDFEVLTGDRIFKQILPEYIRKTAKKYGMNCSATLVDKGLSEYGAYIADSLCSICRSVNINTFNISAVEKLSDNLLDKYGIVVNIIGKGQIISTDIAVILDSCGNEIGQDCLVIDKNAKKGETNTVKDFYIPLKVKPPLGMSNLTFAECIYVNNC